MDTDTLDVAGGQTATLQPVGRLTFGCPRLKVRAELDKARMDLEKEGRSTQIGKLCATPFGVDIVGITELVALIGALVGGATSGCRCHGLYVTCGWRTVSLPLGRCRGDVLKGVCKELVLLLRCDGPAAQE